MFFGGTLRAAIRQRDDNMRDAGAEVARRCRLMVVALFDDEAWAISRRVLGTCPSAVVISWARGAFEI
jgi:hypothetical protein